MGTGCEKYRGLRTAKRKEGEKHQYCEELGAIEYIDHGRTADELWVSNHKGTLTSIFQFLPNLERGNYNSLLLSYMSVLEKCLLRDQLGRGRVTPPPPFFMYVPFMSIFFFILYSINKTN